MSELTLISHIKNEAEILPYWVQHHREIFDTAVIIDYASSDDSVSIIKELAPHWKVVPSQNRNFDAIDCDFEVMQHEAMLSGWKIALNATEFLAADNIRGMLAWGEQNEVYGMAGHSFILVDRERIGFAGLDPNRGLLSQLDYGYRQPAPNEKTDNFSRPRRRLLHRWKTGGYNVGRHSWNRAPTMFNEGLLTAWAGYAPWDEAMLTRKSAIGEEISAHDLHNKFGAQHLLSRQEMELRFLAEVEHAVNLREDPVWNKLVPKA